MDLKIEVKEDKHLEIRFAGEDSALPNMLVHSLLENSDVEFAACVTDHPVVGSPKLVLKTKSKKAKDVLGKAIEDVADQLKEFKAKVNKIKEKK